MPQPASAAASAGAAGPAPARRRLPPADRARQLLRSADEVFAASGYNAVTMDDIARHAGVTRTVLYRHFSSKDEVAEALLVATRERLDRMIGQSLFLVSAGGDAASEGEAARRGATLTDPERLARMETLLVEVMTFVARGGSLYAALLADGVITGAGAHQQAAAIRADMEQHVRTVLAQLPRSGRADPQREAIRVLAVLGACERVAESFAGAAVDEARIRLSAQVVLDLLWAGLQPGRED